MKEDNGVEMLATSWVHEENGCWIQTFPCATLSIEWIEAGENGE